MRGQRVNVVIALGTVVVTGAGCAGSSAGTGRSGAAPVGPAPATARAGAYCRAAAPVFAQLARVTSNESPGVIANRQQTMHDLLDVAPAAVQDDLRTVLGAYEQFLDVENGDVSYDHAAVLDGASFRAAIDRIATYTRAVCHGADPAGSG